VDVEEVTPAGVGGTALEHVSSPQRAVEALLPEDVVDRAELVR
jgi:hypothetical protein